MNHLPQNNSEEPQVFVVEASAGSGKTYALAKRYLELIFKPGSKLGEIPLRTILAITFTNKATVEMKERILDFLKRIIFDLFENDEQREDIFSTLMVDKEYAQKKAALVLDEIIRHYNFFGVQTIDSFINALLSGCALSIDRSANFKIKRDYTFYLEYCLDLAIEEAYRNKEVFDFLEEFLEHYLFVENRTGWFPKEDILELIKSLFTLCNKYGQFFGTFEGKSQDVIKHKKNIYRLIKNLSSSFPEGFNTNKKNSILAFLENNDSIFDTSAIPYALATEEPLMNKEKIAPPAFKKEWKKIYLYLRKTLELEATCVYNPYVKLFRSIFKFFQDVSKKEDVLFLEELNRKARLLFDEEGLTVAELYYRLATRFRNYLIDEFQDTSILQWRNLNIMVEEALSSGGSLFYVGDKKQAIYRFRGGQAQLFEDVKSQFSHYSVKNKHLTRNWRSQRAIVEFNNRIFSKENLTMALRAQEFAVEVSQDVKAISQILSVFQDAVQEWLPHYDCGYVYVEHIDEKNQDQRNQIMRPKILEKIDELKKRFKYEEIAILARDNYEVELITSWLLSAGIAVESEKTLNVLEHSLIKEIISFLRFLHSPPDDLCFVSFIMGEIFSSVSLISGQEVADFIFNLNKDKKLSPDISLYRIFRERYSRVWDKYLDEFFKNVGFVSPYELVVSIYERFSVYKNFSDAQAFFMKFLELIKMTEAEYVDLAQFLTYLESAPPEDLYVDVAHIDSVKVLTIHKSKGLEFPVVIIPFLRMDINPETGAGSSYVERTARDELGLVRITKNHRAFSPRLAQIYRNAYKEACIDELNAIYVALTRPQYELYIYIPQKSNSGKNKARFLIPERIAEFGSKRAYETKFKDTQPSLRLEPSTYKDWIVFLKEEFADTRIKNREHIKEGNILHAILSRIGNCARLDLERLIHEAVEVAKTQFVGVEDFSCFKEKTKKVLTRKELEFLFYIDDGVVFCEKEIVNRYGDLKRIDRLILKSGQVWIIDYKSSRQNSGEYIAQVKEYIEILKDIYPAHTIRGYLVYLDELTLEEVI